jgi:NIPSNAP
MITCFIKYEIDPNKLAEFEQYGRLWITLVNRFGGTHHGYLMPSEGASDVAYASFSFPSFTAYEIYRANSFKDAECKAAFAYGAETQCIRRYERSFLRPVFEGL